MISYDNVKNYEKFKNFELQEISPSTLSCFVLICPTLHVHDQNACSESATSGRVRVKESILFFRQGCGKNWYGSNLSLELKLNLIVKL